MAGKARSGRTPKLTPEVQKLIVDAVAAGNYLHHAAQYAGIHIATLERWKQVGAREKVGIYHDFFEAVKKAEGQAIARNVAIISKAAATSWQAAAWLLERKYFADWGRKERLEHTGKDGGPVAVSLVDLVKSAAAESAEKGAVAQRGVTDHHPSEVRIPARGPTEGVTDA